MNDSTTIDRIGGTTKVAKLCKLAIPTVSNWRKRGIPAGWRAFLLAAHPEAFKRQRRKTPTAIAS